MSCLEILPMFCPLISEKLTIGDECTRFKDKLINRVILVNKKTIGSHFSTGPTTSSRHSKNKLYILNIKYAVHFVYMM